jgi:predicted DNA binding CopG/RHH family protein
MKKRINLNDIEDLGDVELPEELDKKITAMIEQADKEIFESRVTMRWHKEQLDVVKKAAYLLGIPYQIYIRDVVFRKSLDDINQISEKMNVVKSI